MSVELKFEALKRQPQSNGTELRHCEWADCQEEGLHRAPKSREELNTYRWFCKVHAREYNRSWNYYEGMSDGEVEADVRKDTVWQRPTWRISSNDKANVDFTVNLESIHDPFNILKNARHNDAGHRPIDPGFTNDQRRALIIFDMERPGDIDTIKQRYKELVKRHHPDAKGAVSGSDEHIKDINEAYRILLEFVGG